MAERDELQALRALQAATASGDERAQLQALRAVQAARAGQSAPGAVPAVAALPMLRGLLGPTPETSFGEAFARGAGNRVANSALNLGERGINAVANILPRAANMLLVDPASGAAPFGRVPEANVQVPRAEDMLSILRPVEERPVATALGQTAGDVASILALRAPARAGLARLNPQQAVRQIPGVATVLQWWQRATTHPGTARALDSVMRSKAARVTAETAGRAVEAGAEGAVIGILNEGDPLQLAAVGAGGQLAGSAALGLTRGKRLLWAAALAGGGIQLLKSATPGGKDFVTESIESGFDGVVHAVYAGAAARLIGAGRMKSENFPFLNEIPTVARAAVLSIVNDVASESERGISSSERALQHLLADAEQFTDEQLRRLERGLNREKFGETVSELIESDAAFRRVIDSPLPDPGEVAQRRLRTAIEADTGASMDIVIDMRATADAIKRRLPADLQERFKSLAPQQAIARAIESSEGVLDKLRTTQRVDALEINLSELISRATIRDPRSDRRIIDPQRLDEQWNSLTESVREAYSPRQQRAVESFIDELRAAPAGLSALPQLLSRSLMSVEGGELVRRLLGEQERQKDDDEESLQDKLQSIHPLGAD